MLRIGLTGGIGAGKSTVAGRLVELGATLVDADVVAREVVQPGSPGLAEVIKVFGANVLGPDGALDRPALGSLVFADGEARRRLNAIVHPLVGRRTAELIAAAPPDGVLVQDIPLLVEGTMAPSFPLVAVVHADVEERVRRLVRDRGMTEGDARARIAAQAGYADRRAAADVWLDNSGSPESVLAEVDRLWSTRLVPFEANLRLGRAARRGGPRLVESEPGWADQAARLTARVRRAAGPRAARVDHIGSTSVPGLPAKDLIDLQLGVHSLAEADELAPALREVGFLLRPEFTGDSPKPSDPDPAHWRKRLFTSADPGRPVNLHVRSTDSAGYRLALLFRDWMRADPVARADYLSAKRTAAAAHAQDSDTTGYAEAKEPWFDAAVAGADRWATATGWRIPELDILPARSGGNPQKM